jgi:hypothetical protein
VNVYVIIFSVFSLIGIFSSGKFPPLLVNTDLYERNIRFSGYNWFVKSSLSRTGPGANFFSNSHENVWVDMRGRLNLSVTIKDDRWYCAEVVLNESLGYGRYEFELGTSPARLDNNLVAGLFTWDPGMIPHHNEIDIEFSTWGKGSAINSQYVLHKGIDKVIIHRFIMPDSPTGSKHVIDWKPEKLLFESYRRGMLKTWSKIESWEVTGKHVPRPANEQVRINLWLIGGISPENKRIDSLRIRVDRFTFSAF